MRIVIVIMLLAILGSLTSALFYLMKDHGKGRRTVQALSIRIGLSVLLFLAILLAGHFGWIHSTGIPQQPL